MSKQPMLDMFKRVLPAADTRNKKFFDSLTEEERKGFSAWLVMRYLSSAESSQQEVVEHYLVMTNELVNANFSSVKDPEIIWNSMSVVGIGKPIKHPYIAPPKKGKNKKNLFRNWLNDQYPHLNDQELDLWLSSMTKEDKLDMLEQNHVRDKDIVKSARDDVQV